MKNITKWSMNDVKEILYDCNKKIGDFTDLPFEVKYNGRLKTTLARYIFKTDANKTPVAIEVGKDILNVPERKALEDILKHEFAHYYSISVEKSSTGHDTSFRECCKMLGTDNIHAICTNYVQSQILKGKSESPEMKKAENDFYSMLKKMMAEQQK